MANNASLYLRNKLLNFLFNGAAFVPPATYYLALYSAAPAADGTGGTELAGSGYARVAVTKDTDAFPTTTTGQITNGEAITFPAATGDQPDAIRVVVLDDSVGGNVIMVSNAVVIEIPNTTVVYFDPGDLIFTLV